MDTGVLKNGSNSVHKKLAITLGKKSHNVRAGKQKITENESNNE